MMLYVLLKHKISTNVQNTNQVVKLYQVLMWDNHLYCFITQIDTKRVFNFYRFVYNTALSTPIDGLIQGYCYKPQF